MSDKLKKKIDKIRIIKVYIVIKTKFYYLPR